MYLQRWKPFGKKNIQTGHCFQKVGYRQLSGIFYPTHVFKWASLTNHGGFIQNPVSFWVFFLWTLYSECQFVCPKKFSPPNLFAQKAVCPGSIHPPVLNVQGPFALILCMYYRHTVVMCDAKNTDGALAKIGSYFLNNIQKVSKINGQKEKN